jgi:hypothetical protein
MAPDLMVLLNIGRSKYFGDVSHGISGTVPNHTTQCDPEADMPDSLSARSYRAPVLGLIVLQVIAYSGTHAQNDLLCSGPLHTTGFSSAVPSQRHSIFITSRRVE